MGILVGTVPNAQVLGKLMDGGWCKHPKLSKVGRTVLARDRFTCHGCGFKAGNEKGEPYGYMVPASLKHPGFLPISVEHSKTYCPFCISSMAINWSVKPLDNGSIEAYAPGMLIALDELSQAEINRLALCVTVVIASRKVGSQSKEAAAATSINNAMKARQSNLAATISAYRIDKDIEFANAMSLLPQELYKQRTNVITGLRWWPNVDYWKEAGAHWGSKNLI